MYHPYTHADVCQSEKKVSHLPFFYTRQHMPVYENEMYECRSDTEARVCLFLLLHEHFAVLAFCHGSSLCHGSFGSVTDPLGLSRILSVCRGSSPASVSVCIRLISWLADFQLFGQARQDALKFLLYQRFP